MRLLETTFQTLNPYPLRTQKIDARRYSAGVSHEHSFEECSHIYDRGGVAARSIYRGGEVFIGQHMIYLPDAPRSLIGNYPGGVSAIETDTICLPICPANVVRSAQCFADAYLPAMFDLCASVWLSFTYQLFLICVRLFSCHLLTSNVWFACVCLAVICLPAILDMCTGCVRYHILIDSDRSVTAREPFVYQKGGQACFSH